MALSKEEPFSKPTDKSKESELLTALKAKQKKVRKSATEFVGNGKTKIIRKKTSLTKECKLNITVSHPKLIKEGLFKSNYITYKVRTKRFKFEVARRYSDFLWLRKLLVREYPSYYIPAVAKKGAKRSFEDKYVRIRMYVLQEFLDCLSSHKELRSSIVFLDFLKIQPKEEWNKAKQLHQNQQCRVSGLRENLNKFLFGKDRILSVTEFSNIQGKVTSRDSLDMREYSNSLTELWKAINPQSDKLNLLLKGLVEGFGKLSETMDSLSKCTKELSASHSEFNKRVKFGKTTHNQDLFTSLSTTFNHWSVIMQKQEKSINKHLLSPIDYNKKEVLSLVELLKVRDQISQEYFSYWSQLKQKKDRLFSNQDSLGNWKANWSKYENIKELILKDKRLAKIVMLPEETKVRDDLQKILGYFNIQMVDETIFAFRHQAKRLIHSFTTLSSNNIEFYGDMNLIFQQLTNTICEIFGEISKSEKVISIWL